MLSKRRNAMAQLLLSTFSIFLGALGIVWGVLLLPRFWQDAPLNHMAAEFVQGHTFTRKAMLQEALQARREFSLPLCNPTELHSAVILHLAVLNDDLAKKDRSLIQQSYAPLYELSRAALACSPSDGFTWLTLFWLDAERRGVWPENVAYLRLSYDVSPNEGWVAIWRNRLAMTMFDRLPPELANRALHEFVRLLDTGRSYDDMASIFENAPADVQEKIIPQLKDASPLTRQIFAKALFDRGLEVTIPDTGIPGPSEH